MIRIRKPYIKSGELYSRVICDIEVDDEVRAVWFEVENQYKDWLVTEKADAYVIGLLNWAMLWGHDIICDVPVTDELLYNITTILIPTLSKHVDSLKAINIIAETERPYYGKEVGTGCSCGIDSFDAIYMHNGTKYKSMDLTYLCINDVGAFNECYADYGAQRVKDERYQKVDEVAGCLSLPIIKTNSNFADAFKQVHLYTHTYSSVFAIYMLQKMWRIYYYASSGIDYSHFSLTDKECAHYELLSLQCFSTSGLKIYSEGGEKRRVDKARDLIAYGPANKYLHVCLTKPYNCGVCSKCRRTLLMYDALGGLDNFGDVFDLDYYKKNYREYYRWLIEQIIIGDEMNRPVYELLKKRKEFCRVCYVHVPIFLWKKAWGKIARVFLRHTEAKKKIS